jgi:hypothetical protein
MWNKFKSAVNLFLANVKMLLKIHFHFSGKLE